MEEVLRSLISEELVVVVVVLELIQVLHIMVVVVQLANDLMEVELEQLINHTQEQV